MESSGWAFARFNQLMLVTLMIKICQLVFLLLVICLVQFAIPDGLIACPTCKDGLHNDGTAFAYAFSILFMMGMPFVILSAWVTMIYRLRSRMQFACNDEAIGESPTAGEHS